MSNATSSSWRGSLVRFGLVFLVTSAGCATAFALWLHDLSAPRVVFLGSGSGLSLLVSEGPSRLLLATGNDSIGYENAYSSVQPLFARRVDVLLVAGAGSALAAPLAAFGDPYARTTLALAPLPPSAEADAFGAISSLQEPRRIRVGPTVSVTVETALPYAADPTTTFPAWRATVERGESRIVVLSDGDAAALFPPAPAAAVLAVSGRDPVVAWDVDPAVALIVNGAAIGGPELREAFRESARPPRWGFRVAPGEALQLSFVDGGVALPSAAGQAFGEATPGADLVATAPTLARRVRRRARPSPARTPPGPRREAPPRR